MNSMELKEAAKKIRIKCLELCHKYKASHLGGAFSIADILVYLYFKELNVNSSDPKMPNRDRLFYSKGHACTSLYSVLELKGFFNNLISEFTVNESFFTSHVNSKIPGVELSTGSLGHAMPVACGVAFSGQKQNAKWRTFVIVSDGELDEGSNWEAIMFAAHQKLSNMILIVDYNKIQSFGTTKEVMDLDPLDQKFQAFNWNVFSIDGHSFNDLENVFLKINEHQNGKPNVIIANTIKGKGVSFMENQLSWHYKSPNSDEINKAIQEITNS